VNSLKPLLIIAIVGGIGYGAWSRLNRKPDGGSQGWDATPSVQMSDGSGNWNQPAAPGGSSPTYSGLAPANPATPTLSPAPAGSATDPAGPAPPQDAPMAPAFGAAAPGGPELAPATPAGAASTNPPAAYPVTDSGAYGSSPGANGLDPTAAGTAALATAGVPFAPVLEAARRELDGGRLADGLMQLSNWYDSPQLSAGEQEELNKLLSQVSGTVIYSTRSFGEPPYEVQPGERLDDIAARYNITPQLIAKINGIDDPQNLRPGERLKVIRGPFEASISLDKRVMTLWVGGAYAGRFALGIGRDFPPREGQFTIESKVINPPYHGPERTIDGGDPSNPLGSRWLGMAGGYGIHGVNDPNALGTPEQAGCMALGPRDVEDVFDILTIGSRVTIHR